MNIKFLNGLEGSLERAIAEMSAQLANVREELKKAESATDFAVDSKGFRRPPQTNSSWNYGQNAKAIAANAWDSLADLFTQKELWLLCRAGRPGPSWRPSSAAYSHVLADWVKDGFLRIADEGGGPRPKRYAKIKAEVKGS